MSATASLPESDRGVPHRGLIITSAMLASIMHALDATIANVALPRIQGTLSATQDQMAWVLTSYIVATAVTMPLSGWLAGRIGRKRVFAFSIIGFVVASALCGFATSLPELVMERILQGACGAALVPLSQAITLDITPPHKHAGAMAIWVMGVTVGPIIGPALGGWLTEIYNWRWVFFINVPIGIIALFGVLTFMPETGRRRSSFDFFGFLTLSAGVGAFQTMLDRGQLKDWFSSTEIWIEATVSVVGLYLFVVHTLTTKKTPFVSPSLFKDRNFLTGSLFIVVHGAVLFAPLALLPPLLQDIMNYPVVLTGLVTAPRGIGTLIAMVVVTRLGGRVDGRLIIVGGGLVSGYSLWLMTKFNPQMDEWLVIWSGLLQGMGTGFVYVALAAISFATLSYSFRNEGTAIFSLLRNLGSSIGISVAEVLFTRNSQIMHARLAEQVTPFRHGLHALPDAAFGSAEGMARLNGLVTQQAAMISYNNDFKFLMILSLAVLPFVLLLKRSRASATAESVVVE